ncbi:hypothetical protein SPRG_15862 [Saprolegnia parasitica CBS 223.65]|uniref:Homeobox domain-containing protein n=1 Tax=Saprolegnia parasitica (strain CBS 223.65) TaxID=695850 RepID=A0A067BWS8_SAPPC|nr:hypothetical protein SPRG_15862 [Saprolegnia parasitica CBS 223.65]KDO18741.1 hypothetical protein SPRG_15862 [Saprolegnia parasitica CBS 223.65]|eukprot:XP_012210542.1 hypothetical protein SPRG_15862 [Saprolegnia parasitica CBS 223.65]
MSEKDAEVMSMDGDDVEEDLDEMFGSDMSSGSDSDAPLKPPPAKAEKPKAAKLLPDSSVTATVPATDDEASEDNEHEMAPWEQIDLKPAMDLIRSLTDTSLEAARDFTASMVANTNQLVVGCDSVLLEIKHISDIRETMKRQAKATPASTAATGVACACGTSMMPLGVFPQSVVAPTAPAAPETPVLDKSTEDQTDRVLYKIEAAMEKFRELAEMVQTMSVQHEASLMSKLAIPQTAVQTMVSSIHSAAAAATAAAIAQERGGLSRGTGPGYSFSSEQRTKLQIWYYSYPRPLADELELMAQILSLPPYHSLARAPVHPTHVRDWFKRRRFRERMRHVMEVLEAGTLSLTSAEAEVHAKIELRIQTLREAVKPEELMREAARANSATYVAVASSFGKKRNLDQFLSMAQQLGQPTLVLEAPVAAVVKKPRAGILGDPMEVEDAVVVKVASRVEVQAIQNRLQALLQLPKTTSNTSGIQQVMDLLRSMEITNEVRISTNLVADLKTVLKIYKKPSLLRRTTEALMEALGQPVDVKKKKRYAAGADVLGHAPASVDEYDDAPAEAHGHDDADSEDDQPILKQAKSASSSTSRRKKTGAKLHRPMKFSMKQVEALEAWFQKTFKPSVPEMEEYLGRLNGAPLRDPLQTVDVSMTQLRRWFNKRRCLRRPPFALMTKGDEKDATSSQSHDEEDEEDDMDDMDDEDMASEEEARAPLPPPSPSPPPPPPMPPTSIPLPREGSDSSSDSNDTNDSDDDSSDS